MADRISAIRGNQIKDGTVTKDELNADVAGLGLVGGAGSALDVNVDDNTIEITGDSVNIKANGVTETELVDDFIKQSELLDEDNFVSNSATQPPSQQSTKAYVDAVAQGLDLKDSVRVATTAAGTLTTSFENGDTIDNIVLATNDRILIKDQATKTENGVYIVNASGAPTRTTDYASGAEVAGTFMFVEEGDTNADSGWVCTSNDSADTVGTNDLDYTHFSGAGQITAGNGLTKTGNTLDVNVDDSSIEINADTLRVKASGISAAMLAESYIEQTDVDDSSIEFAGGTLNVKALGIDTAELAASAVTNAKLATDAVKPSNVDTLTEAGAGVDGFVLTYDDASGRFDLTVKSSVADVVTESDIVKEDFSSSLNGSLTDFTLSDLPVDASIAVYINGSYQLEGASNDYELNPDSGDTQKIRINGDALEAGEVLQVAYVKNN